MGIDNTIDITPAQRKELLGLLLRHLPGTAVWAFGSRVKWTSRPDSDLDLVAFSTPQQQSRIAALKEALEESSLPFRVDLLVWDDIPESFRENIQGAYVVLAGESAVKQGFGGVRGHHKVLPYTFPSHWSVLKLRDVCKKVGSGATPTGGQAAYLPVRQHWALVRSQNVFDRHFDATGLAFITDEQAASLKGAALQSGDVLLNITGDGVTFARSCSVPEWVLPAVVNQHVSIIRPNPDVADPGYVMAYLTHPAIKDYIEGFNTGGSRRAVTKGHIESFDIPLPTMDDQRAIAHILGTFDNKIELNRRMNETLEAMARAIFQSWFVDFDPVRAKASGESAESICQRLGLTPELLALFPDSFEDSEHGEIPTGWMGQAFGEWLSRTIGGDWGTEVADDLHDVEVRIVRGTDMPKLKVGKSADVPNRFVQASKFLSRRLQQEDIVLEVSGGSRDQPTGRGLRITAEILQMLGGDAVPASFCRLLRPALPEAGALLALHLDSIYRDGKTWEYQNQSTGISNFQTKFFLEREMVINPGASIIAAFNQYVFPLLSGKYSIEAATLELTRDTLLPKLLSGELPVDAAAAEGEV